MRKSLLILFGIMFFSIQVFAQKTITGKVSDDQGNPISNVSVLVKGTKSGTITNQDGFYSIAVSATAKTLVFSSLNSETKELAIGTDASINVSLLSSEKSMDEVVVVGYSVMRKKDVAAAISKIKGSEIAAMPTPTFTQAIQGRAAGVSIAASSGMPGGAINVRIRGVGSIDAGNDPLYVVDGIQINSNNSGRIGGGSANSGTAVKTQNNPLSFLNANDIESIEILKDAASSAIYGAKAAGGVVLITTKKGASGKPKFTANLSTGTLDAINLQKPLNTQDWLTAQAEGIMHRSVGVTKDSALRAALISVGQLPTLSTKEIQDLTSSDWMGASWRTGIVRTAEMSMQAGTQNTSLYMSGSYNKQISHIRPSDFERGTFMMKGSQKASEKITLDAQINLSTFKQNANHGTGGAGNNTINAAYASTQMLTINPIYRPDGKFYNLSGSGDVWYGSFANNPLAAQVLQKIFVRTNQLVGSFSGTYKFNQDLTLKSMVGLDYRLSQIKAYHDPRLIGGFYDAVGGRGEVGSNWTTNFITNTVMNYKKTISGVHNISGMVGIEFRSDEDNSINAEGNSFPSSSFQNLTNASVPVLVGESWTGFKTFSQFGRLGYNYDGRYILGFILRRDGSSRFGSDTRFGIFPSGQVAWNALEENFLSGLKNVSELKLRYSYGESGNDQIGNFDSRGLYGASRIYNAQAATNPISLANPELSWETRTEHNLGLDFGMYNGKITLSADAYRRVNNDLLLDRSVFPSSGWTSYSQNTGAVLNKGLEFLLRVSPFEKAFKWTGSFNISFQKNEVLKLYDGLEVFPGDPSIKVGESLGSYFLAQWAGVNPATGRSMWYDKDGNYTYQPLVADRKFLGNIYPTHFGGLTNNFSYKGFELEVFFQYEYGRRRQDDQLQQEARIGGSQINSLYYVFNNRWTTPGQFAIMPRPLLNTQTETGSVSWNNGDRWLYKTDYIRLKQLSFSYNLQPKTLKKLGLSNVRIYAQGINLWTLTKFPGVDPEFTGSSSTIIPQSKNLTFGTMIGF